METWTWCPKCGANKTSGGWCQPCALDRTMLTADEADDRERLARAIDAGISQSMRRIA